MGFGLRRFQGLMTAWLLRMFLHTSFAKSYDQVHWGQVAVTSRTRLQCLHSAIIAGTLSATSQLGSSVHKSNLNVSSLDIRVRRKLCGADIEGGVYAIA